MNRNTNNSNKKINQNIKKKQEYLISPANFLIAGLAIYLILGYYLSTANFSNKLNSACEYLFSNKR